MFVSLLPGFVVAGSLCAFGILIASILISSPGFTVIEFAIAFAIYLFAGGAIAAGTGFYANILLALFNHSLGKILSPGAIAVSSIGMSVIPVSLLGMAEYAFSNHPDSNSYYFLYYVPAILIGALVGVWCANWRGYRFQTGLKTGLQFNTSQLLAITGWIAFLLALGFGNRICFTAVAIYTLIVASTVLGYSNLCPKKRNCE